LPPKGLQGDISCNAALVLSKINNKKPKDIAILARAGFSYELSKKILDIPKIKSSKFHLVVLPLKLKNATGSPVRAIAFVE